MIPDWAQLLDSIDADIARLTDLRAYVAAKVGADSPPPKAHAREERADPAHRRERPGKPNTTEAREKVTAALRDGPKRLKDIAAATGLALGTIRAHLTAGPFEEVQPGYRLTEWRLAG